MTDCEFCELRKFVAKVFDLHWLDRVDCPYKYDCPYKCNEVSEAADVKEENNDHN